VRGEGGSSGSSGTSVYEPQPDELELKDCNEATISKLKRNRNHIATIQINDDVAVETEDELGEDKL